MGENLEKLLEKSGGWGIYQKIVVTLITLVSIPTGFIIISPVFIYHTPSHRCFIPEFDGMGSNATVNHSTLEAYIPSFPSNGGDFELASCMRYVMSGNQTTFNVSMRNATYAVDRKTEECLDGWVYMDADGVKSASTEFNFVCNNAWKKPPLSSGLMLGLLIGSIMSGPLNDKLGRRIVSLATILPYAASTIALSFSLSFEMLVVMMIAVGISQITCVLSFFVLAQELVDKKHRAVVMCMINSCFTFGYMALPGVAYLLKDWRWIVRACGLSFSLFLPYIFFLPESPRWLASKGRNLEAYKILKRIAHWNGKDPATLDDLRMNNIDFTEKLLGETENSSRKQQRSSVQILFKNSTMRTRSLLICWLWMVAFLCFYTLAYNTSNLGGNNYWNCFIAAALDFPSHFVTTFTIQKFGRRSSVSVCTGLAGIFLGIYPALAAYRAAAITSAMIGKFFAASTYGMLFLYTSELYPTLVRNTGLGMASMSARISSMLAPFLVFAGETGNKFLPFYGMATLGLFTAVLCLFLPETKHSPLPDTMLDAVKMDESRVFSFSFKRFKRRNESELALKVPINSKKDDGNCDVDNEENQSVVFEKSVKEA